MDKKDFRGLIKEQYLPFAITVICIVVGSYALIELIGFAGIGLEKLTQLLGWVLSLLIPLLYGFAIAYVMMPVVRFVEKPLRKTKRYGEGGKNPRGLAIVGAYLLLLAVIVAIFSAILSSVTRSLQVANMGDIENIVGGLATNLDGFYDTALAVIDKLGISSSNVDTALKNLAERFGSTFKNFGTGFVTRFTSVRSTVTAIFFGFIFSIYFLAGSSRLIAYWKRAFRSIFGDKATNFCSMLLQDADRSFSGYIKGQFADALFMATTVSIALLILGVDYAIIIGVLTGIGNLIPYVGPFVAYGTTVLVCVVNGDWRLLAIAIIVLAIIQVVDANVINPRLMSANVEIHPILVIIALIIGGATGGLVGMLVAVPVASFLKIQFERIVDWAERRREESPQPEQAEANLNDVSDDMVTDQER